MITGNEPIHPFKSDDNTYGITMSSGLTKREYFAAMAMQGFCSDKDTYDVSTRVGQIIAQDSVAIADLLIAELNKQPESK